MKREENAGLAAYYFHQGTSNAAYEYLGSHLLAADEEGYRYSFRLWAPNAQSVYLVSDRMGWSEGLPLIRVTEKGVWELIYQSRDSLENMIYKYRIVSDGGVHDKGDPYAVYSKGGADGASLLLHPSRFVWEDESWLAHRRRTVKYGVPYCASPFNAYEVHLGSFARDEDGRYLSYRALADLLVGYVKYMGYTHVELLPVLEHPFDGSWGYQACGFFAPTSRFGTPDDFRYFVNTLHKAGVGVILDWVPAHFPKDEWGLYELDGRPLYEYQGWDRMESRAWGTRFFDLGREEVQSFLVSSAFYFLRELHVDGLRVDAVSAMLYLDYDRGHGEWLPNVYGDNRNLEAIAFLRKLNDSIHGAFPDVLTVAEESTAFFGVTHPTTEGGLGFDLKWNMGFANDFLYYLSKEPVFRRYHHEALNFPMMYAYNERFLLPVSHDEVVHGKRAFVDKIAGSYGEKLATARAAMMYMMSFPGKKMLFMGSEFAQLSEWCESRSLDWFLLENQAHADFRNFIRELNHFYLSEPTLYEKDFDRTGFSWLLADEADKNTVAYRRYGEEGSELVCVISFSGAAQEILLPLASGSYTVVFDTSGNRGGMLYRTREDGGLPLTLNPFEALYIKPYSGIVLKT